MRLEADLHHAASVLQEENPGWVVMWAAWRRRFCAFSGLAHATCVIVEATTPEGLLTLKRQAEAEAGTTQPGRHPNP